MTQFVNIMNRLRGLHFLGFESDFKWALAELQGNLAGKPLDAIDQCDAFSNWYICYGNTIATASEKSTQKQCQNPMVP